MIKYLKFLPPMESLMGTVAYTEVEAFPTDCCVVTCQRRADNGVRLYVRRNAEGLEYSETLSPQYVLTIEEAVRIRRLGLGDSTVTDLAIRSVLVSRPQLSYTQTLEALVAHLGYQV